MVDINKLRLYLYNKYLEGVYTSFDITVMDSGKVIGAKKIEHALIDNLILKTMNEVFYIFSPLQFLGTPSIQDYLIKLEEVLSQHKLSRNRNIELEDFIIKYMVDTNEIEMMCIDYINSSIKDI